MDMLNSSTSSSSASMMMATSPDTFVKLCLLWTALHRSNALPKVCRDVVTDDDLDELKSKADLAKIWGSLNGKQRSAYYSIYDQRLTDRNIDRHQNHVRYHYRYTSRSLSIIGVLGGIVLILLVVAMSTCIKNRRNMILEQQEHSGHESFARQILIDHIRHLRRGGGGGADNSNSLRRNDTPPAYDDVVKTAAATSLGVSILSPSRVVRNPDSACGIANENASAEYEMEPPSYVEAVEREASMASMAAAAEGSDVVTIEVKGEEAAAATEVIADAEDAGLSMQCSDSTRKSRNSREEGSSD